MWFERDLISSSGGNARLQFKKCPHNRFNVTLVADVDHWQCVRPHNGPIATDPGRPGFCNECFGHLYNTACSFIMSYTGVPVIRTDLPSS